MGKWKHILVESDEALMIGVCRECGPTALMKHPSAKNGLKCKKAHRLHSKEWKIIHRYKGTRCERCGFDPINLCQLEVHHKDHDRTNNDPSNFETICANCHRLEHAVN